MIEDIIKNNLISFLKFRTYVWASLSDLIKDESILNWGENSFKFPITIHTHRDEDDLVNLNINKHINLIDFDIIKMNQKLTNIMVKFSYIKDEITYYFIYPTVIILNDKDVKIFYRNIETKDERTSIYTNIICFIKNINKVNQHNLENISPYDIIPIKLLYNDIKFNFFNNYSINEVSLLDSKNYELYLDFINDPTEKIYKLKNINKKENIFYLLYHKDLLDHSDTKGVVYVNSDPEITMNIEYRII